MCLCHLNDISFVMESPQKFSVCIMFLCKHLILLVPTDLLVLNSKHGCIGLADLDIGHLFGTL